MGRGAGHEQRPRHLPGDAGGLGSRVGGVDHGQLGLAGAVVGEADHLVTGREAVHACAHGLDDTGQSGPLSRGESSGESLVEQALADLGLAGVDPGGPHPHQQLAGTGNRVLHVDHLEHVDAAVLVESGPPFDIWLAPCSEVDARIENRSPRRTVDRRARTRPETYVIVLSDGRADAICCNAPAPAGASFSRDGRPRRGGVRFGGGAALRSTPSSRRVHLWTTDPARTGEAAPRRRRTSCALSPPPSTSPMPSRGRGVPPGGCGGCRRAGVSNPYEPRRAGRTDPPTTFFCGAYRFEGDLAQGLLAALPDLLPLRPAAGSTLRATRWTSWCRRRDAPRRARTARRLLDRLLDVALVQLLREHLTAAETPPPPGWFRASADERIGAALRALHADPAHTWTVADLAEVAALSRSTFARQFTELRGPRAFAYAQRLADGAWPGSGCATAEARLAAVATSLGYASEFSLCRRVQRASPRHRRPDGGARRRPETDRPP